MKPCWHCTKTVRTLGPAADAPGVLRQLAAHGMDIARVDLSHGDHSEQARRVRQVRDVASRMKQPVGLLIGGDCALAP